LPYLFHYKGRYRQFVLFYPHVRRHSMNMKHPAIVSLGAFLAVWGTTSNFALDYRSILGSIVAGVFGYASPKRWAKRTSLLFTLLAWLLLAAWLGMSLLIYSLKLRDLTRVSMRFTTYF
jgi:hypothetical protein